MSEQASGARTADYVIIAGYMPATLDQFENQQTAPNTRLPELIDANAFDVPAIMGAVRDHEQRPLLKLDGKLANVLDLANYSMAGRRYVDFSAPEEFGRYLTIANNPYLNGPYIMSFLGRRGFKGRLVPNFVTGRPLLDEILDSGVKTVMISTSHIHSIPVLLEVLSHVRERSPGATIIIGGNGVYRFILNEGASPAFEGLLAGLMAMVDIAVVEPQGETTLGAVMQALRDGASMDEVPNLILAGRYGDMRRTKKQLEQNSLDDNYIRWDEVDPACLGEKVPMQTSRGCVMACNFCDFWRVAGRLTLKSIPALRDELRRLHAANANVRFVQFTDDDFGVMPGAAGHIDRVTERLRDLCKLLIEEGRGLRWSAFIRAQFIDEEIAELMGKAGCELVFMGLESGDDKILEAMNKRLDVAQGRRAVRLLRENGVGTLGSFLLGYPGETEETLARTRDYIADLGLYSYRLFVLQLARSKPIWNTREENGLYGFSTVWRHKTMDSVTAASHVPRIVASVERGYYDGFHPWESYFVLRGKGFTQPEVYELGKLRDALVLGAMRDGVPELQGAEREALLGKVDALVARHLPVPARPAP